MDFLVFLLELSMSPVQDPFWYDLDSCRWERSESLVSQAEPCGILASIHTQFITVGLSVKLIVGAHDRIGVNLELKP